MRAVVRKIRPSEDRLNALSLIAFAIACGASGVAIAKLTHSVVPDAALSEQTAPQLKQPAPPPRAAATNAPLPVPPASAEPAPAASTPVEQPSAAPVEAVAVTPAKPHTKRRVVRGVVVYVRCFGAERPGARFPCPRDRGFEARTWKTLEAIGQCTLADPGRGQVEARLDVRRGQPTAVDLRISPTANKPAIGLDLRAVSKCAEPQLRGLRSDLHTPHFIAAFRFELR